MRQLHTSGVFLVRMDQLCCKREEVMIIDPVHTYKERPLPASCKECSNAREHVARNLNVSGQQPEQLKVGASEVGHGYSTGARGQGWQHMHGAPATLFNESRRSQPVSSLLCRTPCWHNSGPTLPSPPFLDLLVKLTRAALHWPGTSCSLEHPHPTSHQPASMCLQPHPAAAAGVCALLLQRHRHAHSAHWCPHHPLTDLTCWAASCWTTPHGTADLYDAVAAAGGPDGWQLPSVAVAPGF
eukprot:1158835-Pelagomonas_calceolata.AAC.4